MREELEFMIDTIEIVPDNSICYIQAPSVDNSNFLELFTKSKYNWARQVVLSSENKQKIKKLLLSSELENQFQNVTIEKEEEKIFEGFDGMEIGTISKKLNLPNWYVEKYVETKYCAFAEEF